MDEENITVKGAIKCTLSFISGLFNFLNTIFNNSLGILWGIILVLVFQTAMSRAAPSPNNDVNAQTSLTAMLSSQDPSSSLLLYSVDTMESKSYIFQLDEIQEEVISGLDSSCNSISTMKEQCLAHPASCQSSMMSTVNYEKAITKHIQTLYSVKRVCELQNYPPSKKVINRCHHN